MGSHMEWTDENAAHGKNVYRIVGFNEAGEGESAIIETYAGEDVPLAVENLRLVGGATSATLYWDAPTKRTIWRLRRHRQFEIPHTTLQQSKCRF